MTDRKELPVFAFLDGHDGDNDHLKGRDIVLHLPTGGIIEFIQDFEDEPSAWISRTPFVYRDGFGADERITAYLLQCPAGNITADVIRAAIEWYCAYLDREDRNIAAGDMAGMN